MRIKGPCFYFRRMHTTISTTKSREKTDAHSHAVGAVKIHSDEIHWVTVPSNGRLDGRSLCAHAKSVFVCVCGKFYFRHKRTHIFAVDAINSMSKLFNLLCWPSPFKPFRVFWMDWVRIESSSSFSHHFPHKHCCPIWKLCDFEPVAILRFSTRLSLLFKTNHIFSNWILACMIARTNILSLHISVIATTKRSFEKGSKMLMGFFSLSRCFSVAISRMCVPVQPFAKEKT